MLATVHAVTCRAFGKCQLASVVDPRRMIETTESGPLTSATGFPASAGNTRPPRTRQTPAQFTLPGLAWRHSDIEVMQVANFVRSSWGIEGHR